MRGLSKLLEIALIMQLFCLALQFAFNQNGIVFFGFNMLFFFIGIMSYFGNLKYASEELLLSLREFGRRMK